MTDISIRKFVKPAHPGARIPDLDHNNDLPQDGADVVWSSYWIRREMDGDIVLVDETADRSSTSTVGEAAPIAPSA